MKKSRPFLSLVLAALTCAAAAQTYSVKQENGIWWFEHPTFGRLWSFGVDVVEGGTKGKSDNPAYDAHALFPDDKAWVLDTLTKLKDWGFNSIGAWSDDDLFRKYSPAGQRLPYCMVLHLGAYNKAPWNDLFSPDSDRLDEDAAKKLIPPVKDDPYLVGYFTDNELGWWDDTLFKWYLDLPATAPGKVRIVALLREFYHNDFAGLQKEWKTDATSFDGLLTDRKIFLLPGTSGIQVVHAWNRVLCTRYYSLMKKLVRAEDPNHMILGDRYQQYYNLEAVHASKPYIDVVSSNAGADWLDGTYSHFYFETLYNITGKPIVVTEFYFAGRENQTGNRNSGEGFPTVQTQAERAKGFANCVKSFAAMPYLVGAHWFQFYDEPAKGRGDGEDFNMGLVDVKGNAYPETTQAAAAIHPDKIHETASLPIYNEIPLAPAKPMADLIAWDRQKGYVPSTSKEPFADIYVSHDDQNLYVALYVMEFEDSSLYEGDKLPEIDRPLFDLHAGSWHGSIRFNGEKQVATCTDPRVSVFEKSGLKRTEILKIPLAALGLSSLKGGDAVKIQAELFSHARGYHMAWDRSPVLD